MPTELDTLEHANQVAGLLFPYLAILLETLGLNATYGRGLDIPYQGDDTESVLQGMLTFWRPILLTDGSTIEFGSTLRLVSSDLGGPGLLVAPFGAVQVQQALDPWIFRFTVTADLDGFLIKSDAVDPISTHTPLPAEVKITALAERITSPEDQMRIGSATGTNLSVQQFALALDALFAGDIRDYGVLLSIGGTKIVIKGDDGDGFIGKVLPKDPIEIPFDLGIGWSNQRGLYFNGGAALEMTFPINKSLLNILTIKAVYLSLGVRSSNQASSIVAVVSTSASLTLGPIVGTVDRVGLAAVLTFPPGGGNLGPAALNLRFKPPTGAGLALMAEAVSGGGYLFFDDEKSQYGGLVFLEIKSGLAIKAVGLITTKLPDGRPGFSILLIITVEFPPIQLGYGFTLNGLGGLLGYNRTINIEALRDGARSRALDSIMFPPNPVENAPKIISDLQTIFPPRVNSFIIGPMVRIGWGANSIITADLAILIEIGIPLQVTRIALLGRVRMILPDEDAAVVKINLDVIGTLDFTTKEIGIDATLYDSRVGVFDITGQMAMRLNWGDRPTFVLSIGGFNPRFPVPDAFPALQRLAISLATSENPRLRLESYFALTSNTVQLGARLDIYVEQDFGLAGKFSAAAYLGFDALINFDPFEFIVDMNGGLNIKRNGAPLLAAVLDLHLTGPGEWHAWGEVTFEFLGKHSLTVDMTIGDPLLPLPPDPIQILEELLKAAQDPVNWKAQLPDSGRQYVTLREISLTASVVIVHPFGTLTLRQRVAPLEIPVDRFGSNVPVETGPYHLSATIAGSQGATSSARDPFARAHYLSGLTDEEKLALPAFEYFVSGPQGLGSDEMTSDEGYGVPIEYEEAIINVDETSYFETVYLLPENRVSALAPLGAAGLAAYRNEGSAAYRGSAPALVSVAQPTYAITSVETMARMNSQDFASYTEAAAARSTGAAVQVVGSHETGA